MLLKPKKPLGDLATIIFLTGISAMLVFSPYRDSKMEYLIAFLLGLVATLIYALDISYSTIFIDENTFSVKGYFGIRRKTISIRELDGYGIEEKVVQSHGHYEQIYFRAKSGKKYSVVKKAYDNYSQIQSYVESHFNYLGRDSVRNGKQIGVVMNYIWLAGAVFALIVALLKLI